LSVASYFASLPVVGATANTLQEGCKYYVHTLHIVH